MWNCYSCLSNLWGFTSRKSKQHLTYSTNVHSALRTVPNSAEIPLPPVTHDEDKFSSVIENMLETEAETSLDTSGSVSHAKEEEPLSAIYPRYEPP